MRWKKKPKSIGGKTPVRVPDLYKDVASFYRSIDWSVWWEEFYLSIDSKNRYVYPSLCRFVQTKSKSREQRKFLMWYLGPVTDEKPPYTFPGGPREPVDWEGKRQSGGWFSDRNMKALSQELSRRMNALDALRDTGNRYAAHFLRRADQLAAQADEYFRGVLFLPGLNFQEATARAGVYLRFQESLLRYYRDAQEVYARSHGINFEDMSGLVKLMEAATVGAAQQAAIEGKETPQQAAISKLVEMTMAKAGRYSLPLPAEAEQAIIDVVVETQNKKKVQ
jgi:hypothetical protein